VTGQAFTTAGQFLRFTLAGGVAAAANYGSRFVFSALVSFPVAIVLAYLVGMAIAFVLMRQHVFEGRGKPLGRQILWFTTFNVLALLQTLVVSLLLARWLLPAVGIEQHVEAIAHFFGVIFPVVTSYLGHRYATFR
jgi:putative flippase GtrA